jgi:cytochrome c peroxidase
MGARLEDPTPAPPFASNKYYGPPPDLTLPFAAEQRREWKTPPLWGLYDSKPYLHDGRAATIEEAIDWHGGEAAASRERYLALPGESRAHIVLFLSTLRAPTH